MIFTSISELCAFASLREYSEFRLRLSRTRCFVVKFGSFVVPTPMR